ncbi:hypothetical protein P872_12295 [Rhodonellum psychrophilum GCM71 = DSM 17998]|uniref:Uncharacterized protein n=2 Tax=Rhodonellum TaxID=336827 RepID=U5BVC1_9BACT|nr:MULTISPECIES: hypothetical protein [Rhodonellum]ERM80546.1 hypothetical protein P872_12295 [Rhodonellum psychrophilum GCM71 = DSM 17998]SDZ48632.1 hypothetical protein SAMN05444412_11710 [Rhodonellum ikkaensis]
MPVFLANLFENPRGLLQMYHNFVEKVKGTNRRKKISVPLALYRVPDGVLSDGVIIPEKGDLSLLTSNIPLRAEAILFLFEIDKTAKNLFLFCVATKMKPETLEFSWNKKDQGDFLDFCNLFGSKPSLSTAKDAMKLLASQNLVRFIGGKKYMCNPMIVSTPENLTTQMFSKFTDSIIEKEIKNEKLGGVIQEKLFPKLKTLYKEVSI